MRTVFAAGLAAFALALAACGQSATTQGSAEEAGERADTQFEQATEGSTDLGDGPLENAGEAIDNAKQDAEAATDGNPATQP